MGRGINLGNTLEPPQESAWNNGPAQESYFDAYVEAGFTNVRIPVRWDEHTQASAPYAIDGAWMDRVEEVIDWGLARGLYITLNGHHEDWLKNDYSPANQSRYDEIWRQIIARFKDKSDKLLYEIINEPNGLTVQQVDDLNQRILGIIRAQEPTRLVIFGGNMYANSEQLLQAAIPNDDYIIGYYHSYDPWRFCGQGEGTWGTAADYQAVNAKFQRTADWSANTGIPVHLSEFGAVVGNDYNSRMRVYAHYTERAVKHNFAFSVWDDGGMFKVLQRGSNVWPETKDILVHYYEDSPNEVFVELMREMNSDAPIALLEWNNRASGNDSMVIERKVGFSGPWTTVATLAPDAESFADQTVFDGGTFIYRMYTHRADGTLLHGYPTSLRISTDVQSAYEGVTMQIPGIIEVENYDEGGEGTAYHDDDVANQGGGYRLNEGVDIGGDGRGGFLLGYVAQGEWLEYTINVETAGTYSVEAAVASEIPNGAFRISFPNGANTTFATPSTGGWVTITTIDANSDIELEAGEQILRLDIIDPDAFNLDKLSFTVKSTSTEATASEAGFTVSPNPTSGPLVINLPADTGAPSHTLQLFNAAGAEVGFFSVAGSQQQLDLSEFPAGAYWLKWTDGERNLVRKIVVR